MIILPWEGSTGTFSAAAKPKWKVSHFKFSWLNWSVLDPQRNKQQFRYRKRSWVRILGLLHLNPAFLPLKESKPPAPVTIIKVAVPPLWSLNWDSSNSVLNAAGVSMPGECCQVAPGYFAQMFARPEYLLSLRFSGVKPSRFTHALFDYPF